MRQIVRITQIILVALFFVGCPLSFADSPLPIQNWKITAYCACVKCCGKSDAITASGKIARPNHTIALNWLPFGTRVNISGKIYFVEDRGAESHFGTYYHKGGVIKTKHIDIFFANHQEAKNFGVRYMPVEIIK